MSHPTDGDNVEYVEPNVGHDFPFRARLGLRLIGMDYYCIEHVYLNRAITRLEIGVLSSYP